MSRQRYWWVVLLFVFTEVGCSVNFENAAKRSSAKATSYMVHGHRYQVLHNGDGFIQRGIASWYGRKFHGKRTSSGERYDMYAMTAAHKRLPLTSRVEVTNLANGRRAVVRINDRGPFVRDRIIDLSYAAAKQLGMLSKGTASVEIRTLSAQPVAAGSRQARAVAETAAASPQSATGARDSAVFYVQAGAFAERANAYRLQEQIKAAKLATPVWVEPIQRGRTTYYRVRLGPLRNRDAAGQLTRQLADYGVSDARTVASQ